MKHLIILMMVAILVIASCKKHQTQPAAQPAAHTTNTNNTQNTQTCTLSATESSLVGKWYYERQETVYNGSVTSIVITYSGNPAFNTVTFTGSLSAISADTVHYPNFKLYNTVLNGNAVNGLCWKIGPLGNLILGPDNVSTTLIDSLTASRLVYTTGSSYPIISGVRYTLHR